MLKDNMSRRLEREKRKKQNEYEFTPATKNTVEQKSRAVCEHCNQSKAKEFHHQISIVEAIQLNENPSYIKSAETVYMFVKTAIVN